MTSLSTHVLDTERGRPAAGVRVWLLRGDEPVDTAETGPDGRIADLGNDTLTDGTYRLVFDLAALGRSAPFLQRVTIEFRVEPEQRHYHVPLLVTAYAATIYRGS
jgi:hydroxyisourate hydrolase